MCEGQQTPMMRHHTLLMYEKKDNSVSVYIWTSREAKP